MLLTAEITMYPLKEDYIPPIQAIIDRLNTYPDIKLQTFPTATVMMGEYDQVMNNLSDAMQWSYKEYGKAVFIVKFIPDYQAL